MSSITAPSGADCGVLSDCMVVFSWSCGVILYVLLTGMLPFEGNTQKEVFRRIAAAQYNLQPNSADFKLSFAARDLIAKMLTRDWTKRPTVEECLVHPWISGNEALAEYVLCYVLALGCDVCVMASH